jgi:hypothetical protein
MFGTSFVGEEHGGHYQIVIMATRQALTIQPHR